MTMPRKDIYIYGAGGLGREILSLIKSLADWKVVGFIDDAVAAGTAVNGIKVVGDRQVIESFPGTMYLVLAIGDPVSKCNIIKTIRNKAVVYPVLIHPSAILQDRGSIIVDAGSIISAGCVLTTQINIGKHVLLNLNSTVGHDVHIGNYASIMPGVNIAGEVIIGQSVMIGSGANILNRIVISDNSKVGMGAVVTRPVAPNTTVVGVPAKPVNK